MTAQFPKISRRNALIGAATLPAAAAIAPTMAAADGHAASPQNAIHNTVGVGDFQVSTLLAGSRVVEDPQGIFGMNVSAEEFAEVSAANFLPIDKSRFFFNPTVINTGGDIILFDTGLNAAGISAALSAAGYSAEDIDIVVITHMHPDHIGGMMNDGAPTFPNARYVTGQTEYDFWAAMDAGNRVGDMVAANVTPLAEKMTFIGDGGEVAPGVSGMAAFGHTPGHMIYRVESGGQQLLLMADMANHYVWSLAYPDWEVRFDMDKAAAAATRRKILGMVAAERIPLIGYHMPFPGMGYVESAGDGFRYVPVSYQLTL